MIDVHQTMFCVECPLYRRFFSRPKFGECWAGIPGMEEGPRPVVAWDDWCAAGQMMVEESCKRWVSARRPN